MFYLQRQDSSTPQAGDKMEWEVVWYNGIRTYFRKQKYAFDVTKKGQESPIKRQNCGFLLLLGHLERTPPQKKKKKKKKQHHTNMFESI